MKILMYNEIPEFKENNLIQKYDSDIGYDIRTGVSFIISPKSNLKVYTGLHIHIPKYLGGIIQSRSGFAFNHHIEASNAGVIDSGYHDICWIKLYNHSNNYSFTFQKGDRIAQLIFHINVKHLIPLIEDILYKKKVFQPFQIVETPLEDFPKTERQNNGLGSTGIK